MKPPVPIVTLKIEVTPWPSADAVDEDWMENPSYEYDVYADDGWIGGGTAPGDVIAVAAVGYDHAVTALRERLDNYGIPR